MAKQNRSKVVYGASPHVDLLPTAQRAELRHERTMPKLLLAIVLSALLAGGIWAAGLLPVQAANDELAAAETESNDLITQIAAHADEQQTLNAVSKLSTARTDLTATEVLFIDVLDEIDDALPTGVTIEDYTAQLQTADEEGAAPATGDAVGIDLNPLCVADTATLTLTFVGPNISTGSTLMRNLAKLTGFSCVVGTQITLPQADEPQKLTVQVVLGEDALAGRFVEAAE